MSVNNSRVWLITGSSSGFGRSLAEAVLQAGDRVIATARKPEQLADLIDRYPEQAKAIALDVTQIESLTQELDTWENVGINTDFETI